MYEAIFLSLEDEQRALLRRRHQKAKGEAGLAVDVYLLH
jgi:hypothetical protein